MCFIKATSYLSFYRQTKYRPVFGSLQPSACNHITPVMIISITASTMNLPNENPDDSGLVITKSTSLLYFYKSVFMSNSNCDGSTKLLAAGKYPVSDLMSALHTTKIRNHPFGSCYSILQGRIYGAVHVITICFCVSVALCRHFPESEATAFNATDKKHIAPSDIGPTRMPSEKMKK